MVIVLRYLHVYEILKLQNVSLLFLSNYFVKEAVSKRKTKTLVNTSTVDLQNNNYT